MRLGLANASETTLEQTNLDQPLNIDLTATIAARSQQSTASWFNALNVSA
jgi:hypothetical protein